MVRTLAISIILVIPHDFPVDIVALDGTGDSRTVMVTNLAVAAGIRVRDRVAIRIERGRLIQIFDGHSVIDGLTVAVTLIIHERVRPGVPVISHFAHGRRDQNLARVGVMHGELAHGHAIGIQHQHDRIRTHAVVVTVVVPCNGHLNVVARRNQTMIVRDDRVILARSGVIRRVVIDAVAIQSIHAIRGVSRTGGRQLHSALLTINGRSLNLVPLATDIHVRQEDNLVLTLLEGAIIVRDMLQVNNSIPRLGAGITGYRNPLNNRVVIVAVNQTEFNLRRTGAVVVLIVVPDDVDVVRRRLLFPLCVKVQGPVALGGHRGIRVIIIILAGMILQEPVEVRRVQILAVSFLACHTAAAMGCIPVGERPANSIFHRPEDKQLVIVQIILCMNDRRAVTSIVVRHNDLLGSPSGVISTAGLYALFVALQRLRAVRVQEPAIKCIAFPLRLFFQNRDEFTAAVNPDRIILLRRTVCKLAAVGFPVGLIGNPHAVIRIRMTRVLRIYTALGSLRVKTPSRKAPTFTLRRVRIAPGNRNLEVICPGIRANLDAAVIGILTSQSRERRSAIIVRIEKYRINATVAAISIRRNRSLPGANLPASINNSQVLVAQYILELTAALISQHLTGLRRRSEQAQEHSIDWLTS